MELSVGGNVRVRGAGEQIPAGQEKVTLLLAITAGCLLARAQPASGVNVAIASLCSHLAFSLRPHFPLAVLFLSLPRQLTPINLKKPK